MKDIPGAKKDKAHLKDIPGASYIIIRTRYFSRQLLLIIVENHTIGHAVTNTGIKISYTKSKSLQSLKSEYPCLWNLY